ncbi:MAG: lysophospholipid acyltransferase family protein [Bdellovibrionota bacterium]|nr:MAG: lysophospholipid acyltransferase family protein [Bdellovibrionota bacterium]
MSAVVPLDAHQMIAATLPAAQRIPLWIQRGLGRLFVVPLSIIVIALMKFWARFRVSNHRELRETFATLTASREPLLICANHLTLIDSIVLQWALVPIRAFALQYRLLFWNLPARENVRRFLIWRIITYLGKCILVDRMGDKSTSQGLLQKVRYLLQRGEIVNIFPEGTRSRSGRISLEATNYGVGRILQATPGCRVLCVYMRGRSQERYSNFPANHEVFDLSMEVISPATALPGLRGARDISLQIVAKLQQMEEKYFSRGYATANVG